MKLSSKYFVIIGIVAGISAMVITIGFIGQGNVRGTQIFYQENVEQTVIFEKDGMIYGSKGVKGGSNPNLLSRTSFAYILNVINEDDIPHRLYIEEFGVQTRLLHPGQKDTITIQPEKEGEHNYYDTAKDHTIHLGKIKIVSVVPSDDFKDV